MSTAAADYQPLLTPRQCETCGACIARPRRPSGVRERPREYAERRYCSVPCACAARRGAPRLIPRPCRGCDACLSVRGTAGRLRLDVPARSCATCGAAFERRRQPNGTLEKRAAFMSRRFCSPGCYWSQPKRGATVQTVQAVGCGGCPDCLTPSPGPEPLARYSVACDCGIVLSAEDDTSPDPWADVIASLTVHGMFVHGQSEPAAHDAALFAWVVRGQRVETEVAAA